MLQVACILACPARPALSTRGRVAFARALMCGLPVWHKCMPCVCRIQHMLCCALAYVMLRVDTWYSHSRRKVLLRCCVFHGLTIMTPCPTDMSLHVHRAGHPLLGSGVANPQNTCSRAVLQTGGLANPSARVSRAEVPIWRNTERQLCSVELGEPAPKVARVARVALSTLEGAGACDLGGATSLRRIEDADRVKFCKAWAIVARGCLQWSSFGLSDIKEIHLERLFEDRAASTLRKHLSGWRRWMEFCFPLGWSVGAPSLAQVLDFLEALASGACMDRGKGRVSQGWVFCRRCVLLRGSLS